MKLYLAGAETYLSTPEFYALPPRYGLGLLTSAAYTSAKRSAAILTSGAPLVLDSGAFTFKQRKRPVSRETLWSYLDGYEAFVRATAGRWDWIAEMDIDPVAPAALIEEAYERIKSWGQPVVRVWHRNRGVDAWRRYCKECEYVAFSFKDSTQDADLRALAAYAYKEGCKVHAFGLTNLKRLLQIPCYSIDSTGWLYLKKRCNLPRPSLTRRTTKNQLNDKTGHERVAERAAYLRHSREGNLCSLQVDLMDNVMEGQQQLAAEVTEYWSKRGVRFDG